MPELLRCVRYPWGNRTRSESWQRCSQHQGRSRPGLFQLVLVFVGAVLSAFVLVTDAPATGALSTPDGEATSAAVAPLEPTKTPRSPLSLVGQDQPVIGDPARPLQLRLRVNTTALTPSAASAYELAVTVHERASNDDFFETASVGSVLSLQRRELSQLVSNDGELDIRQFVDDTCTNPARVSNDPCLALAESGVYPVVVELRRIGGGPTATKFISALIVTISEGPDAPARSRLGVATILPIALNANQDATSVIATAEEVVRQRVAHPGTRVAFAPNPSSVLRLDTGVLDTLRLAAQSADVISRPFAEVDSIVGGALDETMNSLNEATGVGAMQEALGAVASDVRLIAPQEGLGGSVTLDVGVTRVILPASAVQIDKPKSGASAGLVALEIPGASSEDVPLAALIDDKLVRDLWAPTSANPDDGVLRVQRAVARLSLTAFALTGSASTDPASVVGVVVDPRVVGRAGLSAWLDALAGSSVISAAPISALLDAPVLTDAAGVVSVARVKPVPTPSVTERELAKASQSARDLVLALRSLTRATLVTGPDAVPLQRLLEALSGTDRAASLARIQALRQEVSTSLGSVQLVASPTIRLTSTSGEIPIRIVNPTGRPVFVRLVVSSDRVRFPDQPRDNSDSPARRYRRDFEIRDSSGEQKIPIATSAAGSYPLQVDLLTPSGTVISRYRYTVRSTGLSGIGLALSIVALMTLGAWWMRTIVGQRSTARRLAFRGHPSATEPESASCSSEMRLIDRPAGEESAP